MKKTKITYKYKNLTAKSIYNSFKEAKQDLDFVEKDLDVKEAEKILKNIIHKYNINGLTTKDIHPFMKSVKVLHDNNLLDK